MDNASTTRIFSNRSINKTGNKAKLVNNAYQAYILNFPVSFTDPQEEKQQIEKDEKNKLVLDNGMLTLPSPTTLFDDWIEAPSHLPDVMIKHKAQGVSILDMLYHQ